MIKTPIPYRGNQDALDSLQEILSSGPGLEGIPGTGSGEQEKEGHDPQIEQPDEHSRNEALLRIIEMPA